MVKNSPYKHKEVGVGVHARLEEIKARLDELALQEDKTPEQEVMVQKLYSLGVFFEGNLHFSEVIEKSVDHLVRLLGSKTVSDQVEAVRLIVELKTNGYLDGDWPPALADCFSLVWSREANVKDVAIGAFRDLYLCGPATEVTGRLLELVCGPLTHGDLSSISEILKECGKQDLLPDGLVAHLIHAPQQRALTLLNALGDLPEVATQVAALDFKAKDCPIATIADVAGLAQATRNSKLVTTCMKRIEEMTEDGGWFLACQKTMDASFAIYEATLNSDATLSLAEPVDVWAALLLKLQGDSGHHTVRVLFMAGHLAVKAIIWCGAVRSRLKRQRILQDKGGLGDMEGVGVAKDEEESEAFAHMEENLVHTGLLGQLKPSIVAVAQDKAIWKKCPNLGFVGTLALCKYMVVSRQFCTEQMDLLFGLLFPKDEEAAAAAAATMHARPVVPPAPKQEPDPEAEEGEEADAEVKPDAESAIAVMPEPEPPEPPEQALYGHLRSDLTIAMGDLLWRHPNVVEKYNSRLFSTLEDGQESTRFAGATVLTNLTLGDMVKPKGPLIFHMLVCTRDRSARVSRLARIFFRELNKKPGHVIYNCLPDLLSKLTERQHEGAETAQEHIAFLMQFIGKERHVDQLVDKLCRRIKEQEGGVTAASGHRSQDQVRFGVELLSSAMIHLQFTESASPSSPSASPISSSTSSACTMA